MAQLVEYLAQSEDHRVRSLKALPWALHCWIGLLIAKPVRLDIQTLEEHAAKPHLSIISGLVLLSHVFPWLSVAVFIPSLA